MMGGLSLPLDLGGVIALFSPVEPQIRLIPSYAYQAFLSDGRPDFYFQVKKNNLPISFPDRPDFQSDRWVCQRNSESIHFYLDHSVKDGTPCFYHVSIGNDEVNCVEIYSEHNEIELLPHGLDGCLTVQFLLKKNGLLFHSCGLNAAGHGVLFCGVSESGKSTTAGLWQQYGGENSRVLGDERISVLPVNGKYSLFSTPWHGPTEYSFPQTVGLERIIILKHGLENSFRPLKPSEAIHLLLPRMYLPHWDPGGLEQVLDNLAEMVSEIPCDEFAFTPDARAVEAVWEQIGS